ncbi:winged helix-turn-helix domain-containing protein [Streptomyces sp. NPDC058175]|uniref:helix-turn-helix domain-containing protein n=1 Tax=unclassified Streptomyces TaxID=2593676 RepID=UPI0036E57036
MVGRLWFPKGPGGARCKLDASQLRVLQAVLDAGPAAAGWSDQCWTLARIAEVAHRRFRVEYTLARLDLLLHRIGWSVQVPSRMATERSAADTPPIASPPLPSRVVPGGNSPSSSRPACVCIVAIRAPGATDPSRSPAMLPLRSLRIIVDIVNTGLPDLTPTTVLRVGGAPCGSPALGGTCPSVSSWTTSARHCCALSRKGPAAAGRSPTSPSMPQVRRHSSDPGAWCWGSA